MRNIYLKQTSEQINTKASRSHELSEIIIMVKEYNRYAKRNYLIANCKRKESIETCCLL